MKAIRKMLSILGTIFLLVGCSAPEGNYTNGPCKNHNIVYELVSPTCQHPGYERYKCTNCSYEEIKNQVPPVECTSEGETTIKIDNCTTKHIEKCKWCERILREYTTQNHTMETLTDEGGDVYQRCIYCGYKHYIDSRFTKVNLKITAPTTIDYYNKIKIYYESNSLRLTLKFLNINTNVETEYYLQDIVFKFSDKVIHWNEESTVFEFESVRRNWFEMNTTYMGHNQGLEISKIKLGSEFKELRWSNLYPDIYSVSEIEIKFIESLI